MGQRRSKLQCWKATPPLQPCSGSTALLPTNVPARCSGKQPKPRHPPWPPPRPAAAAGGARQGGGCGGAAASAAGGAGAVAALAAPNFEVSVGGVMYAVNKIAKSLQGKMNAAETAAYKAKLQEYNNYMSDSDSDDD